MNSPRLKDFVFNKIDSHSYHVRYQSPKTGRIYTGTITDMELINATICDKPMKRDLCKLKQIIKEQSR